MEIIGAGFGRTGTTSLKKALDQLGFGPVLHGMDFNDRRFHLQRPWHNKVRGLQVPWDKLVEGHRSAIDWPVAHYWRQLAAEYPDAKIILTHRPVRNWLESFKATILPNIASQFNSPAEGEWAAQVIGVSTFAMDFSDENLMKVYARHIADVRASIPPDRLLVFDVQEGWKPLCRFLEVSVPDGLFPSSNDAEAFGQSRIDINDWLKEQETQPTSPATE